METRRKRRTFGEDFKKQIVDLHNAGKSVTEIFRDYDLGHSNVERWVAIDLYNREIVGQAASKNEDTRLLRSAFVTLEFPLNDIEVIHTDRGSEFDNLKLDEMLKLFDIKRSLSKKDCGQDNAVDESTNKILKNEFA